jgi:hypothetical protein
LNLETCSEQELFTVLDEYRERCSVAYYLLKGDGCQNGVEVPEPERLRRRSSFRVGQHLESFLYC